MRAQFEDLFRRIDWLDLCIEYYDLDHGKRTKPIRDSLLNKFTPAEHQLAHSKSSEWSSYYYLKQRHELVELRREQYTLRDSFATPIMRHTTDVPSLPTKSDWDADIIVRPLGLINSRSQFLFKDSEHLIPSEFSEEELDRASKIYWEYQNKSADEGSFVFDFRELEDVYALFNAYFDAEDAGTAENVEGNAKSLLQTLNYYKELAELLPIHQEILDFKVKQTKNQDIADYINKKYEKSYTANYISTLFRQKIIPEINTAARLHEEIISKIFFPEEFKTCSCCGRTYLRTPEFFVRKARSKDGLNGRCKKCDKRDRNEKKVIELVQK